MACRDIHSAVDGFSYNYVEVCLQQQYSNSYCQNGVSRFGICPFRSRWRNIGVWRYMIATHSDDHSRVITGSSVHNERIERMWRDVYRCVASTFADTFRELGILDPLNEADLHCTLPSTDKPSFLECQESWNNHALSTESNRIPYQLLLEGLDHVWTTYSPVSPQFRIRRYQHLRRLTNDGTTAIIYIYHVAL